jgi:type IV secretory pathway VirJ component
MAQNQKETKATKLIIRVPSYMSEHTHSEIVILAVDSEGKTDKTRSDEIELTLEPMYMTKDGFVRHVKLDTDKVKLVNGEASVGITNDEASFVKLTASCKDKNSGLTPYTVLMATGGYPFGH